MNLQDTLHALDIERLTSAINEKKASFWEPFKKALITGAGAAATAAIASGATWGAESLRNKIEKGRAYKGMVEASPGLAKNRDATKVQTTFNTLWNLNPDLAKDPLTAGSFVERSMQRADISDSAGSYIDIDTARNIVKSRGRKEQPITRAFIEGATRAFEPFEQMKEQRKAEERAKELAEEHARRFAIERYRTGERAKELATSHALRTGFETQKEQERAKQRAKEVAKDYSRRAKLERFRTQLGIASRHPIIPEVEVARVRSPF
jgi:hypothetical protein